LEGAGIDLMQLRDVMAAEAEIAPGDGAVAIGGVTADSRKVKAGDLFVAIPGTRADGLAYVPQALAAGAAAIAAERLPDSRPAGVAFVKVANARRALALAAARLFPRQPGTIAAVTGTSGKTSVAAFARQIWATLGLQAASVGTVGVVSPKGPIRLITISRSRQSRARASRISRSRRRRMGSISIGSTDCASLPRVSPTSRAIISITTRLSRII
jgi:UDP-N-acetylmuramyl tripeptide synthase